MTSNRHGLRNFSRLPVAIILAWCSILPAGAEESFGSFALQNDFFFGHDGGGYSNGVFLSNVRVTSPEESGVQPTLLLEPLTSWLDMPQPTLAFASLRQLMVTPRDKSRRNPDPNDAPYIGALIYRSAHVHVQGNVADMLALDLGVIGPASGAERTQYFVHNAFGSSQAKGWDDQVHNRVVVGGEAYRAWRFPWAADSAPTNGDLVVLGGGGLGNLITSAGGAVLLRYGTGLERSFPSVARVSGRTGDPFMIGRGWFVYAGLSGDYLFYHAGISSDSPAGNSARLRHSQLMGMAGIAYGWSQSALSISLQSATPLIESSHHRQSYGSITYLWHW